MRRWARRISGFNAADWPTWQNNVYLCTPSKIYFNHMKYFRVFILLLISCLLMPPASAQVAQAVQAAQVAQVAPVAQSGSPYPTFRDLTPEERQHYNERPAEILPDAEAAFEKGDYARAIMLCSLHGNHYGDDTRKLSERTQLDAKAKKCYDLLQEMNELYSQGSYAEAKQKARALLYINAQDQTALEIWNSTIKVTRVEVAPDTVSLVVGKTVQLSARVIPAEATNKAVFWITEDNSIATVDQNGLVKAERPGRVEISALTKDSGFTGKCTITVMAASAIAPKPEQKPEPQEEWNPLQKTGPVKVTGITISQESLSLEVGKSMLLSARVHPDNAADKRFVWYSGDLSVASVLDNGYVSAVGPGTTTISVMTVDGNWKDSCLVVVPAPEPVKPVTPVAPVSPVKPVENPVAAPKKTAHPNMLFVAKAGVGTTTNWGFFPELAVGVYDIGGSRFGAELGGYLYKGTTMPGFDASATFRLMDMLYLRAGAGYFSYTKDASTTGGMNATVGVNILIGGHFCVDIGLRYYPKIQVMGTETVSTAGVTYSIPVPETVMKSGVAPSIKIGYAF